jgi:hemerythrin-like domain-containing protein
MKREKFLWPLTQAHHEALMLAKRIREQIASSISEPSVGDTLCQAVQLFWDHELKPHFENENVLVKLFQNHVEASDSDVVKILQEHERLSAWGGAPTVDVLKSFADLLTVHIRFEEDVFFPRIEKKLLPEEKKEIGALLLKSRPAASS